MTPTLKHKGYTGKLSVDAERGVLYGEVLGIRDVVTFEGNTVKQAMRAFRDSVNDYLEFCAETGEPPNKPYSGRFNVRLTPELHGDLDILAQTSGGESINDIVVAALRREVRRRKRQRPTTPA
ncbi:MAG: type II toxin-antitoxin system HicB family antitoxin [Pirellulales bacterium]